MLINAEDINNVKIIKLNVESLLKQGEETSGKGHVLKQALLDWSSSMNFPLALGSTNNNDKYVQVRCQEGWGRKSQELRCDFSLRYIWEASSSSYILNSAFRGHSHGALPKTFGTKDLINEYEDKIIHFSDLGLSNKQIADSLIKMYNKPFTSRLVSYAKAKIEAKKLGKVEEDAARTVQIYASKQRSTGALSVRFNYHIDGEAGKLSRIFYMSEQMLLNYALYSHDIMIIDTTFKQTKYKMFLLLVVGVASNNENVIMATALISSQKEADFAWVFEELKKTDILLEHLDFNERIVITDQDLAMYAALDSVFRTQFKRRRFCGWHKRRNFEIYSKSFAEINDQLPSRIHQLPYIEEEEDRFENAYDQIRNATSTLPYNKEYLRESIQKAVDYFMQQYKDRELWASCFFKDEVHLGSRTTQLVEAANHVIRSLNFDNARFQIILEKLTTYVSDKNENLIQEVET